MSTQTPSTALLRLGWVAAIIYLGFGLVLGFLPSHWDEASMTDQVLYIVFLVGGGLLLIAGLQHLVIPRPRRCDDRNVGPPCFPVTACRAIP